MRISTHAIERWRQRVNSDADHQQALCELRDFLAGATIDSRVPFGEPLRGSPGYAKNPCNRDVCVVVGLGEEGDVIATTVLTRDGVISKDYRNRQVGRRSPPSRRELAKVLRRISRRGRP